MGSKKTGGRKRDNALSVYFDESVMAMLNALAAEYPGIHSRSRLVETLTRYGLEMILKNKAAKDEYEKRLIHSI